MLGLYRPGSVARALFALTRSHHGEVRLTVGEVKFSLDPHKIQMDMEIVNTVHKRNKNIFLGSQELLNSV